MVIGLITIVIVLFGLGFPAAFVCWLAAFLCAPELLPGPRGRAARQINAMKEWQYLHTGLARAYHKSYGYFQSCDYIGVESAYIEARAIVDRPKLVNS
jgi:hypothetical protein